MWNSFVTYKSETMKRKPNGKVSSRPKKKIKNIKKNIADQVFTQYPIIREHLMPYLDEWSVYNISRVNKTLSMILKHYKGANDPVYSLLSLFFKRNRTCCICFGNLHVNTSTSIGGLFCHAKCVPPIKEWVIDSLGVASIKYNNSLGTVFRGFETKNPCFNTQENTLSYYLECNHPISQRLFSKSKDKMMMDKYVGYFNEYYKDVEVRQGYDIHKKVTFCGVRVPVSTVFDVIHPNFYVSNKPDVIVREYKYIEEKLRKMNYSIRMYYSTYIKPQLFCSEPLSTFLKTSCFKTIHMSVFIREIHRMSGFDNYEAITQFMEKKAKKIRKNQITKHIGRLITAYNIFVCPCTKCKKIRDQDWSVLVRKLSNFFIDKPYLTKQFLKDYLWPRLEFYYTFCTHVRSIDTAQNTSIRDIPMILFMKEMSDIRQICDNIISLLKEGYNGNDIYSAVLKNSVTINDMKNTIALIVRRRSVCYCSRSPCTSTVPFCTKHRLCMTCCEYRHCIEEHMLADSE